MAKQLHKCLLCDETFTKQGERMVHAILTHDIGPNGKDRLPLRTVSCWRCAEQIDPNKTDTCGCGFVHPQIILGQRQPRR